jgi:hypothetical protein
MILFYSNEICVHGYITNHLPVKPKLFLLITLKIKRQYDAPVPQLTADVTAYAKFCYLREEINNTIQVVINFMLLQRCEQR